MEHGSPFNQITHEKTGTWSEPNLQGIMCKMLIFRGVPSLQLTVSSPLKVGRTPKGNDRIATIHFQVLSLLVSGRVFPILWNLFIKDWSCEYLKTYQPVPIPLCLEFWFWWLCFLPPCFLVVSRPTHVIISKKSNKPLEHTADIPPKVPKTKDSLPFSGQFIKRSEPERYGFSMGVEFHVGKKIASTRNFRKKNKTACGTSTSFSWDGQQHKTGTVRTCSSLLYHLASRWNWKLAGFMTGQP